MHAIGSNPNGSFFFNTEHAKVSLNIGAIHLRAKYCHLLEWEGIDVAVGLDLRLPSGDDDDVSGPHLVGGNVVTLPDEGLDVDRRDYFDTVLSACVRLWRTLTVMAGVIKNLNDDGLRSDVWNPTLALQGTF